MKEDSEYQTWLKHLEFRMYYHGLITSEQQLCPKGWRGYFDDGLTEKEAIDAEYGRFWRTTLNPFRTGSYWQQKSQNNSSNSITK